MKISISTLFLTFFLCSSLFAQNDKFNPINYIGVGVGYSLDHINDSNISPLNQKGSAFFYTVFYERHSKDILKVNFKYGDGILKSGRSNKLHTSYFSGKIGVTYLKNLSSSQEAVNFYVGGSYELDLLYLDWYNQAAFSYLSTHGVTINAAVSKQLADKHYIESTVGIPVVQFLSRPPYNGLDEFIIENQDDPLSIIFNSKLSSFKEVKSINWNINYRYELSDSFDWKIDYDLNIQNIKTVNEITRLSNRVSTTFLYQF